MDNSSDIYTRESLLKVINALPIAISVIDKNRTITLANKTTARFVNKDNTQLIGLTGGKAFDCVNRNDVPQGCGFGPNCVRCRLRQIIMDTMKHRRPYEMVEVPMAFREQGERHLRVSTLPILLNDEEAVLLSIEDTTEAKINERKKVENEKLAAAVETAGAICHELNQPLMIILGTAELLLEDMSDPVDREANILQIKEQAERLGRATRKLITLTEYKTTPYLETKILDLDQD
ncbi:MAG: PAS domain-containing protein [Desulfobacterales bacterium]|nr:PAS domain-containing protein [Desulfobacterales bacterium]